MKNESTPISRTAFMEQLRRYQKGSITRRHFLNVTGLGTAMAVMGGALPGLLPTRARAQDIGDRVVLATWPNYHDPADFDMFAEKTGAYTQVNVFGSNEEMLAKLQAGGSGWDVFVPTNYAIPTYVQADLIEPLDLSKIPNFDAASFDPRFSDAGTVDGTVYAVPKNWGTTGFAFNSDKTGGPVDSWKTFFDGACDQFDGRVMVHDYQLTTIGNALIYHGFQLQLGRRRGTCAGRKAADRRQTASLCDLVRLPARDAQRRCLADHVLDRRRQAAERRHAGDRFRPWQRRR